MESNVCSRSHGHPPGPRNRAMVETARSNLSPVVLIAVQKKRFTSVPPVPSVVKAFRPQRPSPAFKKLDPQRRQTQRQRKRPPMRGHLLCILPAHISQSTSPILHGVAIQNLPPEAPERHPNLVPLARH